MLCGAVSEGEIWSCKWRNAANLCIRNIPDIVTQPSAALSPIVLFSDLVIRSMRSAAALSAATMALCPACERAAVCRAGLVEGGNFLLQPADVAAGFRQLVGQFECGHHGEARIADLPEAFVQLDDSPVEVARKSDQMVFLAILTGHTVLATVDGNRDLGHGLQRSWPEGRSE